MLKRKQSEAAHTPPPPHIEVVVPAPRCRPTRPPKPPLTPPLPYQTTIIPKVYSALLASSSSSQSSSMAAWSMDGNASAAGPSSWVPQPQSFLPEADAGGLFTQHEMSSGFDYMPSFSAGYDFETSLRGRKARESSTLLPEPATLSKTVGEEAPISQPSIFDFERDSEMGLFTSKSRVPISDDSITQPAPTGTSDWVAVPPNSTGGKMRNYNWPGPHNSNGTPASPSTSAHSSGADNHIGHLALFNQLLQKGDPRVEWVYSDQHPFGPSEFGGGGSGGTARADTDSFAAGTGNKSTLVWSVQVLVDGEIFGRARGNTKKAARNECAKQGLVRMGVAV
ncbi:hypothetical protein B0H14DRAFT_2667176 [Mycena olivaceomarginata]|nr:hypothetical protein B0H14DRAFT_2667176 [Mycena olivaceomarginata]